MQAIWYAVWQSVHEDFSDLPDVKAVTQLVLRKQGANLQRDGVILFPKVQQGIGCIESPNDHHDERFDKELVGIGLLPSALALESARRARVS
jgi:hypothetical protein